MRKFNLIASGFCLAMFVVAVWEHGSAFTIFSDLVFCGLNLYTGW